MKAKIKTKYLHLHFKHVWFYAHQIRTDCHTYKNNIKVYLELL